MSDQCPKLTSDSLRRVSLYIVLLGAGLYFIGGLMVHGVIVSLLGGLGLWVCRIVRHASKADKPAPLPRRRKKLAVVMLILMFCDGIWCVSPIGRMRFLPVEYTRIRHRWWANKASVAHFPAFSPWQAEDVKIFYFPGFLMAGSVFQLGMQVPADAIDDIAAKYANCPETIYGFTNIREHSGSYIYDDGRFQLPEHFTIKIIHGEPQGSKYGTNWNHGCLFGVAYSRTTNQVVYFTGRW